MNKLAIDRVILCRAEPHTKVSLKFEAELTKLPKKQVVWNDKASQSLMKWWSIPQFDKSSSLCDHCRPVVALLLVVGGHHWWPIIEIEINNPPAVWQEWHHILSRSYNNWKASRSLARVLHCPFSLEPYSGLYKHAVIPRLPVGSEDLTPSWFFSCILQHGSALDKWISINYV